MSINRVKKKPFGQAQATFIKQTRISLDHNGRGFLKGKDWRNITPCGGRYLTGTMSSSPLSVETFYIKPIAKFVPHLLLPNHTPTCPHCESAKAVETFGSKVKWIKCPKILFGIASHQYLDMKLYYCSGCNRRFAGYDKKSMQLDAHQWAGYFPFNLSTKFAVDDELISYIVNASNLPTATIKKQLDHMSVQKYLSDHQYYLYLVGANRIKKESKVSANDSQQRTIDSMFSKTKKKETPTERRRRLVKAQYDRVTRDLQAAERSLDGGLPIRDLMHLKKNRNNYGIKSSLKSIGVTILQRLLNRGLETCIDVLESDNDYIKCTWKYIIKERLDDLSETILDLQHLQERHSDEIMDCDIILNADNPPLLPIGRMAYQDLDDIVEEQPDLPSEFSDLQQHHPTGRMGPFCENEASENSPRLEWYARK